MERWEHMVVRRDTGQEELVLTPDPVELHTNRYYTEPRNVVAVLNELGERGWRLVAVHGDDFWLARPTPEPEPETSLPQ